MVWFQRCSVVRLNLRLHLLHAVELFSVLFKRLRKKAILRNPSCAEEVFLERVGLVPAMFDQLVLPLGHGGDVLFLLLHLVNKKGLVLLLLSDLTLELFLLHSA